MWYSEPGTRASATAASGSTSVPGTAYDSNTGSTLENGAGTISNNSIAQINATPSGGSGTMQVAVADPSQYTACGTTYFSTNGIQITVSSNCTNSTATATYAVNGVSYTLTAAPASNGVDANISLATSTGQSGSFVLPYGATWSGVYAYRQAFGAIAYSPIMGSDVPDMIVAAGGAGAIAAAAGFAAAAFAMNALVFPPVAPIMVPAAAIFALIGAAADWLEM